MYLGVAINVHEDYIRTVEISNELDTSHVDYVWIVDFPAPRFAPAIAAKIATVTSYPRIGIGLLPALIYDTDYIVRFTETLVNEFGERFDLLIGPGDRPALKTIGIDGWIPKQVVEKTVDSGRTIKARLQDLGIGCPIWLAAQGPIMIRESEKLDGVLLNLIDREMVKWATSLIARKNSSFRTGVFTPTKIVENPSTPSNDFLISAAIVALGASKSLLRGFDLEHTIIEARKELRLQNEMNSHVLEKIGLKTLLRWGIFDNPDMLVERVSELENLNIDLTVFGPPISHSRSSMNLLITALDMIRMVKS